MLRHNPKIHQNDTFLVKKDRKIKKMTQNCPIIRFFAPSVAAILIASSVGVNLRADNNAAPAKTIHKAPRKAVLPGPIWKRHTIDRSSRGADGVRLADVNGDGLLDIATAWEEGGIIRAYLHPGHNRVKTTWPAVTVGKVKSPEDAVFADLDGDGAVDVISSCEGRVRTMFIHWAPKNPSDYLKSAKWTTQPIEATRGKQSWMFALPMNVDNRNGIDLVVSSKGAKASVGWLQAPKNPRDITSWKYHRLYNAGWIMSLLKADVDGDGDLDVLVTDRKGKNRGVLWLENPGFEAVNAGKPWKQHRVGGTGREVMFMDYVDIDGKNTKNVVVCAKDRDVLIMRQGGGHGGDAREPWNTQTLSLKPHRIGRAKAVKVADLDGDGRMEILFSCESAKPPKSGIVYLKWTQSPRDKSWVMHELSGPAGIKFDLMQTLDIDGDGDLDVLCCEEHHNLGVFWYENPSRSPRKKN